MGTTDQLDLFRGHDSVDVGLRLLDHQVVGEQDEMLGNVDNLEVRERGGEFLVTGTVIGPGVWGCASPVEASPRRPGARHGWATSAAGSRRCGDACIRSGIPRRSCCR